MRRKKLKLSSKYVLVNTQQLQLKKACDQQFASAQETQRETDDQAAREEAKREIT